MKHAMGYRGESQGDMRLFTAIEFEPIIQAKFARVQSEVTKHSVSGNFTRVCNFHLTLVFLGEMSAACVPAIQCAMDEAVRGHTSFVLTADKLGAFNRGGKKIIWVGLNGELQRLRMLYARLEDVLMGIGVIKQKQDYSPHVTLGREVVTKVPLTAISVPSMLPIAVEVREVSLLESKREQGRLVYRKIYSVVL